MTEYKVGDPVWAKRPHKKDAQELPAAVISVIQISGRCCSLCSKQTTYMVDAIPDWFICGCLLRPRLPPPPQREELGQWELCPWQPKQSTVSDQ